ncbi:MAG: hypothetical protein HPY61_11980 [Methanotrichaceae archaeon]|nr:hypothetical protein [Methanotrichaceae archaeon]
MDVMEMRDLGLILREIETISEPCLEEILDYVRFLREKSSRRGDRNGNNEPVGSFQETG